MTDRVAADLRSSFEEGLGQVRCLPGCFGGRLRPGRLAGHLPDRVTLSWLVIPLKTISSVRVRAHGWPEGTRHCAATISGRLRMSPLSCGGAPLDVVKAYLENQVSPTRFLDGAGANKFLGRLTPPLGNVVALPPAQIVSSEYLDQFSTPAFWRRAIVVSQPAFG